MTAHSALQDSPQSIDPGQSIGSRCVCNNLRRASRAITRFYDSQLAPSGIRATQFSILAATNARGPLTLGKLAKALALERTTLTRNLRPLMDRDFISSESGHDLREHQISLTEAGRAVLMCALPFWNKAQTMMEERLGAEPVARILNDLKSLTAAIRG